MRSDASDFLSRAIFLRVCHDRYYTTPARTGQGRNEGEVKKSKGIYCPSDEMPEALPQTT